MMKKTFLATTALTLMAAGIAQAQDSYPDGIRIDGEVTVGTYDLDFPGFESESHWTFDLEGQIDIAPQFGIGFDVSAFAQFDGGGSTEDRYEVYGYYTFAEGQQLRFGYVPTAIDGLLLEDRIGGGTFLNTSFDFVSDPLARQFMFNDGDEPLGLAYVGDYGAISAAASVHFNPNGDGELYALSAMYEAAPQGSGIGYVVGGGVEILRSDTASADPGLWLRGGVSYQGLEMNALYVQNNVLLDGLETWNVSLSYDVTQVPGLRLGADYTSASIPGMGPANDLSLFGIGAEYEHESGVGIGVSAIRVEQFNTTFDGYSAEVFFRF